MSVSEKVAYLRGLMEGLDMDEDKKEAKLFNAIIEALDDVASELSDIDEDMEELADYIEELDEDLGDVEEFVYDLDDDCDCCCDDDDCDCCCDDDDCDCDCCCDDEDLYEVECPACGEVICIDGCIVDEGEMDCPNCGEHLEFEMDEEEEDEE